MADVASEIVVNDIVHGEIKLPDYIRIIIDTEQFERLRYISQLGLTFVYPSSNYSRFDHSIGTFHLASELIKQIKMQLEQEKNKIGKDIILKVTNEEVKCVEIAALCHDLGHGPYSHFWETALKGVKIGDKKIETKKHEKLSAEIFEKYIWKNESVKSIMTENGLGEEHVELIKYLIKGDEAVIVTGIPGIIRELVLRGKHFLFEIVANKKSGLDVDKFDYLCRDSIYLGWSNKNKIHDIKRIMHFLRVAKDERNEWHLAMRDREIFHIHDVFYYRYFLHRNGYQHKTVKAIECMFKQAIKQILEDNDHRDEFIGNVMGDDFEIKINTDLDPLLPKFTLVRKRNETNAAGEEIPIEEVFFSPQFISRVCDHHVWEIMKKHTSCVLKEIQERKLIKLHCQIQVTRKENTRIKSIMESVESLRGSIDELIEQLSILENAPRTVKDFLDQLTTDLISISNDAKNLFARLYETDVDATDTRIYSNKIGEIYSYAGDLIRDLNKLNEMRQKISTILTDLTEKLRMRDDVDDSISRLIMHLYGAFNNLLSILQNISRPAEEFIRELEQVLPDPNGNINLKSLKDNIKSVFEKCGDFLVENGDIQTDSLAARLKQSYPIISDVATSKFSLQSEDKGNPLLAVRFYKKDGSNPNYETIIKNELNKILNEIPEMIGNIERRNNQLNEIINQMGIVIGDIKSLCRMVGIETRNNVLKCFNMKEEELPDLVKLKTDEFIMMIFINHGEARNLGPLDKIINALCTDPLNANQLGIENQLLIESLKERYKFRQNVY